MRTIAGLSLLALAHFATAHGDHHHDGPAKGETAEQYAQRHMSSEHHIDNFDTGSFFQLHDLNGNGMWDKDEIEAIYGVHHVYSQQKSRDEIEHQKKADYIVESVLKRFDSDGNGKITLNELEKVGLANLPNFDGLGAEGHHYDVESEFFLHHEEQYHSTPETQTDEAYNHPEDVEHFAHHEDIELKEAEREARFQGISVEEVLKYREEAYAAAQGRAQARAQAEAQEPMGELPPRPKYTRTTPPEMQEPGIRFKDAVVEGREKEEWGAGEAGYKAPTAPSEKLRKNLPYKNGRMQYKFRRAWGDF
ncbi:hypothetical protein AMATHDRAFT_148583 [Amanita thiersii Skay4041]|uniref:EF-hand domain-containing protein n=1 Tax=Amanita thiersii Skay4041 TaxID=703135 RepID=A0A2A9NMZ3_9AGAR|nr:hypothetical protein AMATHDRAFT_148583 [Amanita thiersii Skay4041]